MGTYELIDLIDRRRDQDIWSTAAAEYWVPPLERRVLHRPTCVCCCGPVVEVDEDMVGKLRCIKCGRPLSM